MRTYLLKRLLLMVPTLLAVTLIAYVIMRLAPGDPTRSSLFGTEDSGTMSSDKPDTHALELLRKEYYLDRNPVAGYFCWLADILSGQGFGRSITYQPGRSVVEIFAERLPVTIKLNVIAIFIIYLVSVPLGAWSAVRHNRWDDRMATILVFVLWALPVIWVGPMLQATLGRWLELPTTGISPDSSYAVGHTTWQVLGKTATYYVMPIICLVYGGFAGLSRYTRGGMLEVLRQDYIRTARAKGLAGHVVIFKHALRNALIPIVTLLAGLLPGMVVGSLLVEKIFGIPGMGQLSIIALNSRDYPLMMFSLTVGTGLVLTGILMSDLMYALVDPRITYD